jgi:hypothetical protein
MCLEVLTVILLSNFTYRPKYYSERNLDVSKKLIKGKVVHLLN